LVPMTALQGLASRYRPRRLVDVVGQTPITAVLRAAVASGRLPQQLLFSGGSGLGKTTLARIVASSVLCEAPSDGDACGECPSCRDVHTGSHPDVVEVDAASNGGKEEVRDIAARANVAPLRGSRKVYIIDEVHGLSRPGGEAFLKLLEEPPPHVMFMLATTDPDKMARANRGRCVEFALRRPAPEVLAEHVRWVAAEEGCALSGQDAAAIVEATDPELGVRGALMVLEQVIALHAGGAAPADALGVVLGLPPPELVAAVTSATVRGDPAAALAALAEARLVAADSSILSALVRAAHRNLLAASGPASLDAAAQRLAAFVDAAGGSLAALDLAVYRAAAVPAAGDLEASFASDDITSTPVLDSAAANSGQATDAPSFDSATSAGQSVEEVVAAVREVSRVAAAALDAAEVVVGVGTLDVRASGVVAQRIAANVDRIEAATGRRVRVERADADDMTESSRERS
jgi:DNA polymerase III subunit gamma/tau